MFKKDQVQKIGKYYIYPIFLYASHLTSEDADIGLTNGHCYYYADRLVKFLQGKWRNVGTEYLSDDEKEKRNKEIGRVCSFNSDHYFVEYDGNYFDGDGVMVQDEKNIWLWKYESGYQAFTPISYPKSELYYQGTKEAFDAGADETMDFYKTAIWNMYDLVYKPFEDELISKLEKASKDNNDVGFDAILNIYEEKSMDLLKNDPGVKLRIQDILKGVEENAKKEREKWAKYNTPNKNKSEEKKYGDLSDEELKTYLASDEFKQKFEENMKRFKL